MLVTNMVGKLVTIIDIDHPHCGERATIYTVYLDDNCNRFYDAVLDSGGAIVEDLDADQFRLEYA